MRGEDVDEAFKMLVVQDQQPVETFCANGVREPPPRNVPSLGRAG
jgi:hypothetical protein